jgi:hypothetical protein
LIAGPDCERLTTEVTEAQRATTQRKAWICESRCIIPLWNSVSAVLQTFEFDRRACLSQHVFPVIYDLLRDLLSKSNRVVGIVFGQPPQDRQLRTQHVTIGNCGDDFACG